MRDHVDLKLAIIKTPVLSTIREADAGPSSVARMGNRLIKEASCSSTSSDISPSSPPVIVTTTVEVHPITIRKTPKFPSRDRHLAIRRKKPMTSTTAAAATSSVVADEKSIMRAHKCEAGDWEEDAKE